MSTLQLVKSDFQGNEISFTGDGWFNATQAAAKREKDPVAWLRQRDTAEYVAALANCLNGKGGFLTEFNKIRDLSGTSTTSRTKLLRLVKETGLVKTKSGSIENGGGTWLHPKLAVAFSRWLDVDFGVWCDLQIDNILRGNLDKKKLRHETASSFKVMSSVLQLVREEQGKVTASHHYVNEARLINYAASGKFEKVDRDSLTTAELNQLAKLEEKNAVLLGRGVDYESRKKILEQYAIDIRNNGQDLLILKAVDRR
jgi:hypothetical protein